MAPKVTKKDNFALVRSIIAGEVEIDEDESDLLAFIDNEVALLDKRAGVKGTPTKNQLENEVVKLGIIGIIADNTDGLRAGAIAEFAGITIQRATALLKQLVTTGAIVRNENKKVVTFTIS